MENEDFDTSGTLAPSEALDPAGTLYPPDGVVQSGTLPAGDTLSSVSTEGTKSDDKEHDPKPEGLIAENGGMPQVATIVAPHKHPNIVDDVRAASIYMAQLIERLPAEIRHMYVDLENVVKKHSQSST